MGKNVFFVTNNATKLPIDASNKMRRMGLTEPKLDHIYTSAGCIAKYVVRMYPEARKVFAIGEVALRKALEAEGIEVIGADTHVLDPNVMVNETVYDNL